MTLEEQRGFEPNTSTPKWCIKTAQKEKTEVIMQLVASYSTVESRQLSESQNEYDKTLRN